MSDALISKYMPSLFEDGLDVWSNENGRPGDATYNGAFNASIVATDQDFGSCLELQKTTATQRLRYMKQTRLSPGLYLRISARVKAVAGSIPNVRIAGWAGKGNNLPVSVSTTFGPELRIRRYGEVYTISAIVGIGHRDGVDMPWTTDTEYGHFGLDLVGNNGGIIRIDDMRIEDVTGLFLRDMIDWVDVRDYGAKGDGVTDDLPAFQAAKDAAKGRSILVPSGKYVLKNSFTFNTKVRFIGTVSMAANHRLNLQKNFDLPSYIDAFGNEPLGFQKALQALMGGNIDHDTLDLCGRIIDLDAPIDVKTVVGDKQSYETRRVLKNGRIRALESTEWTVQSAVSQASYNPSNPYYLTNVENIANIPVGSLIVGKGVGREVYVRSCNIAAKTIQLSQRLHGPNTTQNYTFTRFRYLLDFSGFESVSNFNIVGIDFSCEGRSSAVMLGRDGITNRFKDCRFSRPKHRGITSIGRACQGLVIDQCDAPSNEMAVAVQDRQTILFNVNSNDTKIRHCQAIRFRHFGVMNGSGHMIVGNHWFQGDENPDSPRTAGIVFSEPTAKTTLTGNYIDNSFIEWTNEHHPYPNQSGKYSFGGMTLTGNICIVSDAHRAFSWLVMKPYGSGHFIDGLSVTNNIFHSFKGVTERAERVDTSIATLNPQKMRNITFQSNTFYEIEKKSISPVTLTINVPAAAATWVADFGNYLPFFGQVLSVTDLIPEGRVTLASGATQTAMPYVLPAQSPTGTQAHIVWPTACKGKIRITGRLDIPS